ncbi:hypothetical protein C8J56DRAFT_896438 [Mycena floridula]|nr:hypothetical protein C8J56DRAFT_896438 [Mycena floridula]
MPLFDSQKCIIAVLAGHLNTAKYVAAADQTFKFFTDAGQALKPNIEHIRGTFSAVNFGIHYDQGHQYPTKLKQTVGLGKIIDKLVGESCVQQLASYADSSFHLWAPKIHEYYNHRLSRLYIARPELLEQRNFVHSVFPCCTINFGGNVWCYKHHDILNCPFSWCAITALGKFNPKLGGHLVLWDLKLIEFPHASTILIPSATLTHSNIPVQPGDERISFTQYCAGPIFRFVDAGFCTEKLLKLEDPVEWERLQGLKPTCWEMGLSLFSTMDELLT